MISGYWQSDAEVKLLSEAIAKTDHDILPQALRVIVMHCAQSMRASSIKHQGLSPQIYTCSTTTLQVLFSRTNLTQAHAGRVLPKVFNLLVPQIEAIICRLLFLLVYSARSSKMQSQFIRVLVLSTITVIASVTPFPESGTFIDLSLDRGSKPTAILNILYKDYHDI
jgi:hypothetical protein